MIGLLKDKNKKIIIPKINGLNLNHYLYENNILIKKNNLGIPEPLNGIKIKINLVNKKNFYELELISGISTLL